MKDNYSIELKIQRGEGNYEFYKLKLKKPTSILILLRRIFWNIDSTLGFYDGCGTGKCKGCYLKVNGKVELACIKMIEPKDQKVILEPIRSNKVIKDLLTR